MVVVKVTQAPFKLSDVVACVEDPACGAVVTFQGMIRSLEGDQSIRAIRYEAYEPMASKEMMGVALLARSRWGVRVALWHRTGRVGVGERSLAVAVAGAHRAEAFQACEFIVDEIKKRVPIWKVDYEIEGSLKETA